MASMVALVTSVLGVIFLLSALHLGTAASASFGQDSPSSSLDRIPDSSAIISATSVNVTKTVDPPHPDTGSVVSICFTISGLEPGSLDVVLAQDVSGSMQDPAGGSGSISRLEASQAAASIFVNLLPATDRIAVVPYSNTAYLAQPLTSTKGAITRTLFSLTATGFTNIGEGIGVSHQELITSPRYLSDTIKAIILMSDGKANLPVNEASAREYALQQAGAAAGQSIRIYTIGFGSDADASLLQDIANLTDGRYYFAPDSEVLRSIYLTLSLELHSLAITDILTPNVEADCSQWPQGWCVRGPTGVTTLTIAVSDTVLMSNPAAACFTATVNLDPNYSGPVNLPGSGICYRDSGGQTICQQVDNPHVSVGGRKISGDVFFDANANGYQDAGETGIPNIVVRAAPVVAASTDMSGNYVLRTSSEPTVSVTVQVPPGYAPTTSVSKDIPPVTGAYTVHFGMRAMLYLPVIVRGWPLPDIVNGGFENGWTGWAHGGELSQTITSANRHLGSFSALLGNPAYACQNGVPIGSAWMEQAFGVPDTTHPTLSFWYNIFTQDINPYLGEGLDSFDVRINGALLFRDARRTGPFGCDPQVPTDLGWRNGQVDLSAYRGQQIRIRFENRNQPDRFYNTWTFVDDVQFMP